MKLLPLIFSAAFYTDKPPKIDKKEGKVAIFKSAFRGTDFQQTKAKLIKGSSSLNLLRLIKLVALFMVSNLSIFCRAACPGSASFATESSAISTLGGATS